MQHLPDRRSVRLRHYDYGRPGAYFVTICVEGRAPILASRDGDRIRLSDIGQAVDLCWRETTQLRKNVQLDEFVIMPDHIHGILWLVGEDHSGEGAKREFSSPRGDLGSIVRGFKAASTRAVNELRQSPGGTVWQRGYYEHVVRSDSDLNRIREYIRGNPAAAEALQSARIAPPLR